MPTSWTEASSTGGWQEGQVTQDDSDYFVDWFFEGVGFSPILPWSGTEVSISATGYAEKSVAATSWTEVSP